MATNALNYQQSFPFSTEFSTFEAWNGNFIVWFGEQNIPYNTEVNWRDTAYGIAGESYFAVYPIPFPDTFATWQDWADAVAEIINGRSFSTNPDNTVVWLDNYGNQVVWTNDILQIIPWTS